MILITTSFPIPITTLILIATPLGTFLPLRARALPKRLPKIF